VERELRIAPILTGGTSLAVWIGGVTAELYRVVNCYDDPRPEDEPYRALLGLTQTRALVDVITGTSAGGLNGVLLSTAWSLGVPTASVVKLRDLWMDLGSIDSLIRSPNEKDPPSLLRGDDYFWPELTGVVERLEAQKTATIGPKATEPPDTRRFTDLALTVTTLSGELTRRTDDIGQELQETRQDHTLRFTTDDFGSEDPEWRRRLALAARTSASIPGVFEASYLPVASAVRSRPAFEDRASFSVGRWAVDGGVLANQPIGAARRRIDERSAGGELRRVALFVNPTPSLGPPNVADDPDDVPPLVKVAASAFTAPRNIGIRGEIDQLREHNERLRRAVDVRRAIARVVAATDAPADGGDPVVHLARSLYDRFRDERALLSVTTMLDRVAPTLADDAFDRRQVEDALVAAILTTENWLPREFTFSDAADAWSWGIAPLEYSAGMLLELIRRVYRLPASMFGPGARDALGDLRGRVHSAMADLGQVRRLDSGFWEVALARRSPALQWWAEQCYEVWPKADAIPVPGVDDMPDASAGQVRANQQQTWAQLWQVAGSLARIAIELRQLVAEIDLDPPEPLPVEVVPDRDAINDLVTLLDVGGDDRSPMIRRLVALHIVAVALGDTSRRAAQIEFIEVSWNAPNTLDPRLLDEKLAGTQFNRLGAFVKRSWRANDWMWGRMDGAAQLVRLLLDPRRLRQIGVRPQQVVGALEALDGAPLDPAEQEPIERELGYLVEQVQHRVPVPAALPLTTAAFTRRVQVPIAREELPEVYFAVRRSKAEGGGEGDKGDFRLAFETETDGVAMANLGDAAVVDLFARCKIGSERASGEVGGDMLTRTAGRTVVVLANAITGERSGLQWPSRVARPFRQAGLFTYAMTRSAAASTTTGLTIAATLYALAGAILAMFLLSGRTETEINSGLVLLALTVLGAGVFFAILRSGVVAALPGFLALLVVALALLGPDIATVVSGSAEDPSTTWKQTLFLGDWPVVTFVVVAAVFGLGVSALARYRAANAVHQIAVDRAALADEEPPGRPIRPIVDLVLTVVVALGVLVLHQEVFRYVLVGEPDVWWRSALIDAGIWLGARSIVVVVAGLAVFGLFFGLAWDRTVRGGTTLVRRLF
jgi:patatin-related protein